MKIFSLWNPNGLNRSKWDFLVSRISGICDLVFFTESHDNECISDDNWNFIYNSAPNAGVCIAHYYSVAISDVWKSDDGRVITCVLNDGGSPVKVFLGYWPAGETRLRRDFNRKYGRLISSADMVLGDFNWVENQIRDSTWTRPRPSAGLDQLLSGMIDPAVIKLSESDGLFTNRHLGAQSRIDRVYVRPPIKVEYLNNLDFYSSEGHCPVLYKWVHQSDPMPQEWSLRPSLFTSRSARSELRLALDETVPGETETGLNYLQRVKQTTQAVQKRLLRDKQKWIYRAKDLIKKVPKSSPARAVLESQLRTLGTINKEKKALLASKQWTLSNECPDAMLTRLLKASKAKSVVSEIRHPVSGQIETDPELILDGFHHFYNNLYQSVPYSKAHLDTFLDDWHPVADQNKIDQLSLAFTKDELDSALGQMKDLKAPGCGGMPALPFKLLPVEGETRLLNTLNECMRTGQLPDHWKTGQIVTLFKKGDKLEIANRRPITLLETEYKILAKMVANRLNPLLPELIHQDQVGFIPGRIIFDNVLMAHEILRRDQKFAINVDFQKAYDSVSHNAIFDVLSHLGLPVPFVNLIKGMISGSKARVRNGSGVSEWFPIERGVKQGCPLAPLLFALVIEPLANRVRKSNTGTLLGTLRQSILLYADDIFLFAANSLQQRLQLQILEEFRLATGLTMNRDKSFHISSHNEDLGIPRHPQAGFKYLGFWFDFDGLADKSQEYVAKIEQAVQQWQFFSWNTRRKASILKCYVFSKIWYYTFIADMDHTVTKLDKLAKDFLWKNRWDGKVTRRVKMRQERTQVSTDDGGLGLFDLSARFKAQKVWIANLIFTRPTKIGSVWKHLYSFSEDNQVGLTGHPHPLVSSVWDSYQQVPGHHRKSYDKDPDDPNAPDHAYIGDLKGWSLLFSPAKGPIRTERQQRLLDRKNVDLLQVFKNVKRWIRDVNLRDFIWNLCHGTLWYDREKKCPCGETRSLEHTFFTCAKTNQVHPWYDGTTHLHQSAYKGVWDEEHVFKHLATCRSVVSLSITVSLLRSLWISREAPQPSKRIFKESLQSAMVAQWYYAKHHPDYRFIPLNLLQRFNDRWHGLFKVSQCEIPTLIGC